MPSGISGIDDGADAGNEPTSGRQRYRPHKPKIPRQKDTSLGSGKALIATVDARSEPIELPRPRNGGTASKVSESGFPVASRQSGKKTIYVKNLCVDVSDDDLREPFAKVGIVTNAEVDLSTRYGPEIWGVVDFKTPEDATKARERFHNTCQPEISGMQRLHIEIRPYMKPARPIQVEARQKTTRYESHGKRWIKAPPGFEDQGDRLLDNLDTSVSEKSSNDSIPSFKPYLDALDEGVRSFKVSDISLGVVQPPSPWIRSARIASNQSIEMRSLLIKNVRNTINRDEICHVFRPVANVMWIHLDFDARGARMPTARAIVDFETSDQARFALDFLYGERSTICRGAVVQIEWSRDSAFDSDIAYPRKRVPTEAASGLVASPFAWNQSNVGDESRPLGSSGVYQLSPGAQTFLSATPANQFSGNARILGPTSQDSDRAQHLLPKIQHSNQEKSSTLQIDNIDCNWTPSEVTFRIKKVVKFAFEPSVVKLFRSPETAKNCSTRITFIDSATAEQAAERIRSTKLDGNLEIQVYSTTDHEALIALWRKEPRRVRLDNVGIRWQGKDLYNRLVTVMEDMTGCVLNIKAVPTEYEGTLSYVVTFDSPATAAEMHSRLDNQSLGGPDRLGASVILPR